MAILRRAAAEVGGKGRHMPKVAPSVRKANQNTVRTAREWLERSGLLGALIAPTRLGLDKDYFDATQEVRAFLKSAGIHDYDRQLQGEDHKVVVGARWATPTGALPTEIALYRPKTTKLGKRPGGDPRIRISGAKAMAQPRDVLVLVSRGLELEIINFDHDALREYITAAVARESRGSAGHAGRATSPELDQFDQEIREASAQPDNILLRRYAAKLEQLEDPARSMASLIGTYHRCAEVVVLSLRRAKYQCEVPECRQGLFRPKDGSPYLEVHHLKALAQGGPDTLDNTAALCPRHHREVHCGSKAASLQRDLQANRQRDS